MSFTQTVVTIKQADGTTVPMIAYTDGTNTVFGHAILGADGALTAPATSGNQTTANSTLATIATQTNGVATAARQDTGNTALAAMATSTGDLDTNLGAKADAAAASDTGTFSLIALLKRGLTTLASILTACQAATPAGTNLIGKVGLDQTTPGTTNRAAVSTAPLVVSFGSFTRPANTTAYGVGQLVANSTTAASVAALSGTAARGNDVPGRVSKVILKKSGTTTTLATFRVHLFNANPVASAPANGDGGNFIPAAGGGWLGSLDVSLNQVFGDSSLGIGVPSLANYVDFTPAAGTPTLYALLEARAAYVPVSGEVFTLTVVTE
jgi:hypothetical protein